MSQSKAKLMQELEAIGAAIESGSIATMRAAFLEHSVPGTEEVDIFKFALISMYQLKLEELRNM